MMQWSWRFRPVGVPWLGGSLARHALVIARMLAAGTAPLPAREKSVRPGINDRFRDPDVESCIEMFERIQDVASKFSIEPVRCGKGTVTGEVKESRFDFERQVPLMQPQHVMAFHKRAVPGQ